MRDSFAEISVSRDQLPVSGRKQYAVFQTVIPLSEFHFHRAVNWSEFRAFPSCSVCLPSDRSNQNQNFRRLAHPPTRAFKFTWLFACITVNPILLIRESSLLVRQAQQFPQIHRL